MSEQKDGDRVSEDEYDSSLKAEKISHSYCTSEVRVSVMSESVPWREDTRFQLVTSQSQKPETLSTSTSKLSIYLSFHCQIAHISDMI